MKHEVPLLITAITGILVVIAFVIPHSPFGDLESRLNSWFTIVFGFTAMLGFDSLIEYHLRRIRDRHKDRGYSVVLLIGLVATFVVGIYSWVKYGSPQVVSSPLGWVYTYMIIPLSGTMFALLAFFISSAAYRAFRIKSWEATLLLLTACLVMLARVPIGNWLWAQFAHGVGLVFPNLNADALAGAPVLSGPTNWILMVPQMAAKRGITLGIYLGAVAMSIRIILGIERTYMSS